MKAMGLRQYGGPEVLEALELPRPDPAPGEVRVRVHAISINPVDCKWRRSGTFTDFPVVLGWDISGVVDALGEGVSDLALGDEVFGMVRFPAEGRGYAEYVTSPAEHLAHKPAALNHIEAAATTLAPLTALQAFDHMDLKAGQTVLIHAAAGGVGHFAVQLAKARGARVIATASAHNRDFVASLGADEIVDYHARPFEEQVSDVDAVFDTVGGDTFARSFGVVRRGGHVITIAAQMTPELELRAAEAGIQARWFLVAPSRPQLQELAALAQSGHLRPHIGQTFALEDVAQAHRAQETGRSVGKNVLIVQPD